MSNSRASSSASSRQEQEEEGEKQAKNPLILKEYELTEGQKERAEAAYEKCDKDTYGNITVTEARSLMVDLWAEEDKLDKDDDDDDSNQKEEDEELENNKNGTTSRNRKDERDSKNKKEGKGSKNEKEDKGSRKNKEGRKSRNSKGQQVPQDGQKEEDEDEEESSGCNTAETAIGNILEETGQEELSWDELLEAVRKMHWKRGALVTVEMLFKVFDDDEDGYIEAKDLTRVMDEIEKPLKPDQVRGMMAQADHDNDKKLGIEEFREVMLKQYK